MRRRIVLALALALALPLMSSRVLAQAEVGLPAPEYLGRDGGGNDFNLSAYQGKVVVATFWASWCAPCKRELPLLEGLQKTIGSAEGQGRRYQH